MAVEIKELLVVLPYLGNLSLALRTHLQNSINKNLSYCKIKVIFKSATHICNFSVLKVKCLLTYPLMYFANTCVVDVMLPIMVKR